MARAGEGGAFAALGQVLRVRQSLGAQCWRLLLGFLPGSSVSSPVWISLPSCTCVSTPASCPPYHHPRFTLTSPSLFLHIPLQSVEGGGRSGESTLTAEGGGWAEPRLLDLGKGPGFESPSLLIELGSQANLPSSQAPPPSRQKLSRGVLSCWTLWRLLSVPVPTQRPQ